MHMVSVATTQLHNRMKEAVENFFKKELSVSQYIYETRQQEGFDQQGIICQPLN